MKKLFWSTPLPASLWATFWFGTVSITVILAGAIFFIYGANAGQMFGMLARRSPELLTGSQFGANWTWRGGYLVNIAVSIVAMLIATVAGVLLGLGLVAHSRTLRWVSSMVMNMFRNSPWLVILYAMLYLLPFEFRVAGHLFSFAPFAKAVIGLSVPVMANVAEIFRGSVQTIHSGQWESARSLGYGPLQILRRVIVPQAIPRMIPNAMNLYAMLTIGTSLIVVTGTDDVLSVARVITGTEGESVATAIYIYVLFLFFIYCFPIALLSRWAEQKIVESSS